MTAAGARGGVAVGVLAEAGHEAFLACLHSVLAHTQDDVPVLTVAPDQARAVVDQLAAKGRIRVLEGGARELADAAGESDLALLDGSARVGEGWLDELRAALPPDGTAATASALTFGGGVTGLGRSHATHAPDRAPDDLAEAVRRHARHLRPGIAETLPACRLVTRAALEIAGPLDAGFDERCSRHGLLHVAADGVLVVPVVGGGRATPLDEERPPPVSRAIAQAVRAVDGLSITIDGRVLTPVIMGTQVQTLELIAALHRTGAVSLRVVVPPDLGSHAREALEHLDGVEVLAVDALGDTPSRTTVVHRPYQVSSPEDMLLLRRLGERVVVTQQDLMSYDVASYHPNDDAWQSYRRLTTETLSVADAVVAFSDHVRDELVARSLVGAGRVQVVPLGVDHHVHGLAGEPAPPNGADEIAGRPFLLCIGSDLRHKNRRFALSLVRALRDDHGWDGLLVLAGPPMASGSSQGEEAAEMLNHPGLADAVVSLPSVDEATKRWLYREAAAVVYPTLREGFGLVPFEAAAVGTPCFFAPQSALLEHLPPETALLTPWSPGRSAEVVTRVLADPAEADRLVERIRDLGADLTWDRTAGALLAIYEDAVIAPPLRMAPLAWSALEADGARARAENTLRALREDIGPTGLSLVGDHGLLPEEIQRTVAALARRPATRAALFRSLTMLRRAAVRRGP